MSIPQLANLLIERSQNTNWVVVFKSLVTTHHLMCYGNEVNFQSIFHVALTHMPRHFFPPNIQRFTQYLASSNCSFQLSNYLDKGNVAGNLELMLIMMKNSHKRPDLFIITPGRGIV